VQYLTVSLRALVLLVTRCLVPLSLLLKRLKLVMDAGVNRKAANQVPVYLCDAADGGTRARFDTVANTERGINLRLKHASSRLRVPHIHPRYVQVLF